MPAESHRPFRQLGRREGHPRGNAPASRTLWLHCGFSKTGTSALQNWCALNAHVLAERGVSYPPPPSRPDRRPDVGGNCYELVHYVRPNFSHQAIPEGAPTPLTDLVSREHAATLVSNEFLQHARTALLRRMSTLLAEHDIRVRAVFFARSIAERAFSRWQQNVKQGKSSATWETYLKDYTDTGERQLQRFAQALGGENVTVLNYDTHHDIVRALLGVVLGDANAALGGVKTASPRINRSLSEAETVFAIAFRTGVLERGASETTAANLTQRVTQRMMEVETVKPMRITLAEEQLQGLAERCGPSLAWINQNFLPDDPIALSRQTQPAPPSRFADPEIEAAARRFAEIALERPSTIAAIDLGHDPLTAFLLESRKRHHRILPVAGRMARWLRLRKGTA